MTIAVETPQPSPAEVLLATYGDTWEIWREVKPDSTHGDWHAERHGDHKQLRAPTVQALGEQIREAQP